MMIKKNLLFFLLFSVIITGGVSCLSKGENRSSGTSIAVVDYKEDMGGFVMNLPNAILAAPELASKSEVGDCILADFTIDYGNQPSANYTTATEITVRKLNNTKIDTTGTMISEFQEPILKIALSTSPYYNGNIFVEITREETNNQVYEYELIFNSDSIDENGIRSVFLKSKKLNTTAGNPTNANLETFNLKALLESGHAKDTTYENIEQKYRFVSLNFKYLSGLNGDVPVYSNMEGNKPVDVLIFK